MAVGPVTSDCLLRRCLRYCPTCRFPSPPILRPRIVATSYHFLTSSPSYSSTESIRQLAAQTGAQLPFSTSQHSLLQAPASRVEDLSLYDSSAPHSTHSSGSAPASQTGTPESYDSTSQPRFHLPTQDLAHTIPSSHPQHAMIQSYQLGINTAAYDLRFTTPGFPVHHSIVFKHDAFTNMSFDAGFT